MHDPLVVVYEIRRPWPRRLRPVKGERRRLAVPFTRLARREFYWPSLITIWHREPDGRDSGTVCRYKAMRWHVHHWKIQVRPAQSLQRRLFQRCEWCNGPHTKNDPVNVSHSWHLQGPWWSSRRGVFHGDCSSAESARYVCVCADPVGRRFDACLLCGKRISDKANWVERARVLAQLPPHRRPHRESGGDA